MAEADCETIPAGLENEQVPYSFSLPAINWGSLFFVPDDVGIFIIAVIALAILVWRCRGRFSSKTQQEEEEEDEEEARKAKLKKMPVLVQMPRGAGRPNQGLEWVKWKKTRDSDGDWAHRFSGPFSLNPEKAKKAKKANKELDASHSKEGGGDDNKAAESNKKTTNTPSKVSRKSSKSKKKR